MMGKIQCILQMPCEHNGKAGNSLVKKGRREIKVVTVLKLETYSVMCRYRRKAVLGQVSSCAKPLNKWQKRVPRFGFKNCYCIFQFSVVIYG